MNPDTLVRISGWYGSFWLDLLDLDRVMVVSRLPPETAAVNMLMLLK